MDWSGPANFLALLSQRNITCHELQLSFLAKGSLNMLLLIYLRPENLCGKSELSKTLAACSKNSQENIFLADYVLNGNILWLQL